MGALLAYEHQIETMICGECGITFGAPSRFFQSRRSDGKDFYCPNGHCRVYRKTTEELLREEVASLKVARDEEKRRADYESTQREIERREAAKERKRVLTRAGAGVCQCCNRTFKQLAEHMKSKHPDMVPAQSVVTEKRKPGRPRKVSI